MSDIGFAFVFGPLAYSFFVDYLGMTPLCGLGCWCIILGFRGIIKNSIKK